MPLTRPSPAPVATATRAASTPAVPWNADGPASPRAEASLLTLVKAACADRVKNAFVDPPCPGAPIDLPEYYEALGFVMEVARTEILGQSQTKLAAAVAERFAADDEPAVRQPYIHRVEQKANPSLGRLAALASALKLAPSLLCAAAETAAVLAWPGSRFEGDAARRRLEVRDLLRELKRITEEGSGAGDLGENERKEWSAFRAWQSPGSNVHARFPAAVGRALRMWRYYKGWTQAQVVAAAVAWRKEHKYDGFRVSKASLSQLETGAALPSLERLAIFASVYGVPMPALVHEAERQAWEAGHVGPTAAAPALDELTAQVEALRAQLDRLPGGATGTKAAALAEVIALFNTARTRLARLGAGGPARKPARKAAKRKGVRP